MLTATSPRRKKKPKTSTASFTGKEVCAGGATCHQKKKNVACRGKRNSTFSGAKPSRKGKGKNSTNSLCSFQGGGPGCRGLQRQKKDIQGGERTLTDDPGRTDISSEKSGRKTSDKKTSSSKGRVKGRTNSENKRGKSTWKEGKGVHSPGKRGNLIRRERHRH